MFSRAALTTIIALLACAPPAMAADKSPGGLYAPFPEPSERDTALEIFGQSTAPQAQAERRRFAAAAALGSGPASSRAGAGDDVPSPLSLTGPLLLVGVGFGIQWLARRRGQARPVAAP